MFSVSLNSYLPALSPATSLFPPCACLNLPHTSTRPLGMLLGLPKLGRTVSTSPTPLLSPLAHSSDLPTLPWLFTPPPCIHSPPRHAPRPSQPAQLGRTISTSLMHPLAPSV